MRKFVIAIINTNNVLEQEIISAETAYEAVKQSKAKNYLVDNEIVNENSDCFELNEDIGEAAFDSDSNFGIIEIV